MLIQLGIGQISAIRRPVCITLGRQRRLVLVIGRRLYNHIHAGFFLVGFGDLFIYPGYLRLKVQVAQGHLALGRVCGVGGAVVRLLATGGKQPAGGQQQHPTQQQRKPFFHHFHFENLRSL